MLARLARERMLEQSKLSMAFSSLDCGTAQSILYHALTNEGYVVKPAAIQSLKNWIYDDGDYGHAFLTATKEQKTFYVVDATFEQFLDHKPAKTLSQTPQGQTILNELLETGHFEITEENAPIYLGCFLNDKNLELSPREAYDFLINPPKHEYHLTYSNQNKSGSIENLKEDGLLLKMS